jgi:hypothetical protein
MLPVLGCARYVSAPSNLAFLSARLSPPKINKLEKRKKENKPSILYFCLDNRNELDERESFDSVGPLRIPISPKT